MTLEYYMEAFARARGRQDGSWWYSADTCRKYLDSPERHFWLAALDNAERIEHEGVPSGDGYFMWPHRT